MTPTTFGAMIREIMQREDITVSSLARRAGIARTILAEIVNDSPRYRVSTYAPRLVDVLGAPALRAWLNSVRAEALEARAGMAAQDQTLARLDTEIDTKLAMAQHTFQEARAEASRLTAELAAIKAEQAKALAALEWGQRELETLAERVAALG